MPPAGRTAFAITIASGSKGSLFARPWSNFGDGGFQYFARSRQSRRAVKRKRLTNEQTLTRENLSF